MYCGMLKMLNGKDKAGCLRTCCKMDTFIMSELKRENALTHLSRIKQLPELVKGCSEPFAFCPGLVVHRSLHVLLMPLVDRSLTTCQEPLSQDDKGTVILLQQPHDPGT